jgi:uncharacterized protein YPO0396
MRPSILAASLATALTAPTAAVQASSEAEIAELRSMLEQMRTQYERRIQDLEDRLAQTERQSASRLDTRTTPNPVHATPPAPSR